MKTHTEYLKRIAAKVNRSGEIQTCRTCLKRFYLRPSRIAEGGFFCNRKCRRRISWPALADVFWSHVKKGAPNICWNWTGPLTVTGYGEFKYRNLVCKAHRLSYEIHTGPIPKKKNWTESCVMHACDNRRCVNPAHLHLGTSRENILDCVAKDRHSRGMRNGLAKLTDNSVRIIRATYAGQEVSMRELGRRFGVSHNVIGRVLRRSGWKHVA